MQAGMKGGKHAVQGKVGRDTCLQGRRQNNTSKQACLECLELPGQDRQELSSSGALEFRVVLGVWISYSQHH